MDTYYYFRKLALEKEKDEGIPSLQFVPFSRPEDEYFIDYVWFRAGDESYARVVCLGHQIAWEGRATEIIKNDRFILHYVASGRGYFNGQPVHEGQCFVVTPNSEYTIEHYSPFEKMEYYWISLCGHGTSRTIFCNGFNDISPIFDFPHTKTVCNILDTALYCPPSNIDMRNYLMSIHTLIVAYHSAYNRYQLSSKNLKANNTTEYYMQAMKFISEHFTEDIKPPDIAEQLHISYSYLRTIFNTYSQKSINHIIAEYRIDLARELLLNDNLKISYVASLVGFKDYSTFKETFKRITGVSPSQYVSSKSQSI